MRILILLLLMLTVSQAKGYVNETHRLITTSEASQVYLNPQIFVLDVRTTEEYTEGHLKGAVSIHYNEIICLPCSQSGAVTPHHDLPKDKATPILVYCDRSRVRSTLAVESLSELGYGNLRVMVGGFDEWVEKGYDYVRGDENEAEEPIPPIILTLAAVSLAGIGLLLVSLPGFRLRGVLTVALVGAVAEASAHIGIFLAHEKGCPTCIAQWRIILGALTGVFILAFWVAMRRGKTGVKSARSDAGHGI